MPTVKEHYADLLAGIYSWMLGGFEQGIADNVAFIERHGLAPRGGSGRAIDLGAGCGFQAIPLARAGYRVTAIDLDGALLDELERHRGELPVRTIAGDLLDFEATIDGPIELAVCMTDTLLHLDSAGAVEELSRRVFAALEPGGRFVATFRDLSQPLEGLDRFIPVRGDDDRVLTCFLEYEDDTVKVHDLLYQRSDDGWTFSKSFYRKLRLPADRCGDLLRSAGFDSVTATVERGLVTVIAEKAR